MLVIPIDDVPSQTLAVSLGGQLCQVDIYQKDSGLYLDLYDASQTPPTPFVIGVLCENLNRIVRFGYLGFEGDLAFGDTQGDEDPSFGGLGTRFVLGYLTAAEVALIPTPGAF